MAGGASALAGELVLDERDDVVASSEHVNAGLSSRCRLTGRGFGSLSGTVQDGGAARRQVVDDGRGCFVLRCFERAPGLGVLAALEAAQDIVSNAGGSGWS
jgi:hypothetical protein